MILIWQTLEGAYSDLYYEWITQVIFSQYSSIIHVKDHGSLRTVRNNAIIIYFCNRPKASDLFLKYLYRYTLENKRFYLFHLSNDTINIHDNSYYSLAQHVFYTNPYQNIENTKNATWVPLGFRTGFMNYTPVTSSNPRKYSIAYVGDKSLELIKSIPKSKQLIIPHSRYAFPIKIKELYLNSSYTYFSKLNISTLFEALECGSIPVIEHKQLDFKIVSPIFDAFYTLYAEIPNTMTDSPNLSQLYQKLKQLINTTIYSELINHLIII